MDDTISAMMDVARLITRGSDVPRAEAQRIAAERRRRVDRVYESPTWVVLLPVSVAYTGGLEQPVERLVTLQAAIAKAVHLVTVFVAQLRSRFRPSCLSPDRTSELGHS
jgi:hypothetical protein